MILYLLSQSTNIMYDLILYLIIYPKIIHSFKNNNILDSGGVMPKTKTLIMRD